MYALLSLTRSCSRTTKETTLSLPSLNQAWFEIIRYCVEEVRRQRDTDAHIIHMVRAWAYAIEKFDTAPKITPRLIARLGTLVSPLKNPNGFRQCQVVIGEQSTPSWQEVPRLIGVLCAPATLSSLSPQQLYVEFEQIHPFRDGNGRVGKILLCWKAGELDDPFSVKIPNPWNIQNP